MLTAGTAFADITPEKGEDLCGFAARAGKPTAGIHDRLFSRWLSLGNGADRVLISSNDLIGISREFHRELRNDVASPAGIPARNICVTTTHTHSGPATVHLQSCGRADDAYLRRLNAVLRETAARALPAGEPVRVGVACSQADWAINRRQPGHGAVDNQLVTVAIRNAQSGAPVATICHYACHPVVMGACNLKVSADYPGYLQTRVAERTGAPCLFLNGACGDLNPRDADQDDFSKAEKMGHDLADRVLVNLDRLEWLEDVSPACRTVPVELPVRIPASVADFDERHRQVNEAFGLPPELFAGRIADYKRRLEQGTYPRSVPVELTLLTLGPQLAFVFIPGEVFTEIGLEIQRLSPFRHTLVCGFSNGTVGYLPTRKAYAEGGYEPYGANFFYDFPEFDPSLEEVLLAGITKLFSQAVP